MVDGVWKHGGVLKEGGDSGIKSICIFYVESNHLTVLSIGSSDQSTDARSIFFNELLKLVTEKYSTLRAHSIQFGSTLLNTSEVKSSISESESNIIHKGAQLSLRTLSALFGITLSLDIDPRRKIYSSIEVSSTLRSIASVKPNSDGVLVGDDRVNLVYRLTNSIPYFVALQGLLTFGDRGIHTLWIVYRSIETDVYSSFAIAPGAKPSLAWQFVEASAIPLPAEYDPSDEILQASEILNTALSLLIEVDTKKYEYVGLRNMRELEVDIKIKENELFSPIDDLLTAPYVLKSSITSALSSCVSEHIEDLKHNIKRGFAEIGMRLETAEHQVQTQVLLSFMLTLVLTVRVN